MYFIPIFSILPNPDYIHLKDPDSPHATFSLCAMKIARSTQLGTYNLPPLIILWWQHIVFTPSKSHVTFSLKLFRNKKQKRRKQKPNRGEKRSQRTCKTVYTDLFRATHKKEKNTKEKRKTCFKKCNVCIPQHKYKAISVRTIHLELLKCLKGFPLTVDCPDRRAWSLSKCSTFSVR